MSLLPWIKDEKLFEEVTQLLDIAGKAQLKADKRFKSNIIDPFSAIFEMSGFDLDYNEWERNEKIRQAQKTLQNHIGEFHQNILGVSIGWENKKVGNVIDLFSESNKIIAEVKNKYNTISGGKLSDLYYSLDRLISPKTSIYKGYTAFYVSIIPKKSKRYNCTFVPSDKEKRERCPSNEHIREIDGASFYSLVTGVDSALENLFDVLPEVIEFCSKREYIFQNRTKLKDFFTSAFG